MRQSSQICEISARNTRPRKCRFLESRIRFERGGPVLVEESCQQLLKKRRHSNPTFSPGCSISFHFIGLFWSGLCGMEAD